MGMSRGEWKKGDLASEGDSAEEGDSGEEADPEDQVKHNAVT